MGFLLSKAVSSHLLTSLILKVAAAYNHADYIPQRKEMMQAWADYLDGLREEAREESAKTRPT